MRKVCRVLLAAMMAAGIFSAVCRAESQDLPPLPGQNFTPLLAKINGELMPVKMSNGKFYMLYELLIVNASTSDVVMTGLTVTDPLKGDDIVFSMSRDDIADHMHGGALTDRGTTVPGRGVVVLTMDAVLPGEELPVAIDHNISFRSLQPSIFAPETGTAKVARTPLSEEKPVVIGPPLSGNRWVASNVGANHGHRNSLFALNGAWYTPERWAVDYIRLTDDRRGRSGDDPKKLDNYPAYGQDLLAVKDGKVLQVVDGFDDLAIGEKLKNLSLGNVGGNYVLIDIGDGYSAFYAHFIKGTIKVKPGDTVKRGQVLGKCGNSGNSTAPHLHLHIIRGKQPIAAQGVPYVISGFVQEGELDMSKDVEGAMDKNDPCPITTENNGPRTEAMPADMTIVSFPD